MSTTEKIAVLAPMPSVRITSATAVAGVAQSAERRAYIARWLRAGGLLPALAIAGGWFDALAVRSQQIDQLVASGSKPKKTARHRRAHRQIDGFPVRAGTRRVRFTTAR